ncbi:hypothetical protein HK101_000732 [Irineochytrium annulatum]|nr:hypothetical protein HK101_000732 [Irineochytrium annulatum]
MPSEETPLIEGEVEKKTWFHHVKTHRHKFGGGWLILAIIAVAVVLVLRYTTDVLIITPGKDEEFCESDRNYLVAGLLSFFLGTLGIDRFYLGYVFLGLLKLLTAGGFGIWWLVDFVLILVYALPDANGCLI